MLLLIEYCINPSLAFLAIDIWFKLTRAIVCDSCIVLQSKIILVYWKLQLF